MTRLKLSRWFAIWTLAIALAPSTISAQDAGTLSISGTFSMDAVRDYQGTVGADLAAVFAQGNEHWWLLTLHGVTYSYDTSYYEWNDESGYGFDDQIITRVHATSFDFQFFGPDADVLNEVISRQLIMSQRGDDVFLELRNGDYYDSLDPLGGGPHGEWYIRLVCLYWGTAHVSFSAGADWTSQFPRDESGYPSVEPQRVTSQRTVIGDFRAGNSGTLESYGDIVDIGSAGPPLPPSPPTPPTLSISDASVREGNKGTSRLDLTVTLSRSSDDAVTVNYQTANSTALANNDYYAASGTVTFQPGQTSRTISIAIRTDRKREPNEAFSVQLSYAVGATINDGVGTATILNDD
jgi:hypothetical protein